MKSSVFTIEPEFRIPEEQLYIRLEDMIVIVPRSIAGIEKVMADAGLLQRYGRIR